ncbi:hemolymph lipopolysaccharide-binding protein [Anabrus simplex]|uniref:hemolymph lipopolysaccharide-binding protein n=1 Tax=Anabrus simplex TaxID=316456 RepID=UPI0035A3B197
MRFRHYKQQIMVPFIAYITVLVIGLASGTNNFCPADGGSTYIFTVKLNINRTGHRIVSVNMEHETPFRIENNNETGLYITHSSTTCGKKERIELSTTAVIFEHLRPKRPDYEFFPGVGYYKLHTWGRTWDDARATCLEEGGHLLVINSEEEADVVRKFFSRNPSFNNVNDPLYGAYIGVTDRDEEGKFVTVTGQLLEDTGYTNWEVGEPKSDRGQNYVAVESHARMHDINNGKKMGFFCEIE